MIMKLDDTNIGLLLAFEALLQEPNVTHAAKSLGISQSALSARLNKLRHLFQDQLFVPASPGRGMTATPRATELQAELTETLARLRRMIEEPADFDPARTTRTFVVAIHENPAAILAPGLVARLIAAAPTARIAFVLPTAEVNERLERGEIDILIAGPDKAPGDLRRRRLFADRFLTAQRKGHPRGTGPLDLESFCAFDHLLVSADGGGFSGLVDNCLAALGRSRRVVASVQSYALAPLVLAATDCLCTLPGRFLAGFSAILDLVPPPVELGAPELVALWHPRSQNDKGHAWLRERLYEAAAASTSSDRQRAGVQSAD